MPKVAVRFDPLDIREFYPQLGMFEAGYKVFTSAENLAEKTTADQLDVLAELIYGRRRGQKSRLKMCTLIWPDLFLMAVNNPVPLSKALGKDVGFPERPVETEPKQVTSISEIPKGVPLVVVEAIAKQNKLEGLELYIEKKKHKYVPRAYIPEKSGQYKMVINPRRRVTGEERPGRGNHKPRLPDFLLLPPHDPGKLPMQALLVVKALNEEYVKGTYKQPDGTHLFRVWKDMHPFVKKANIATKQEPSRIFRYYFWLLADRKLIQPILMPSNSDTNCVVK